MFECLTLPLAVPRAARHYGPRSPTRPPSQTWRTFPANHAHAVWAAVPRVVQTLSFKTRYALRIIA